MAHPKSDNRGWVELKWTKIKVTVKQSIVVPYPKNAEMEIIEVSS